MIKISALGVGLFCLGACVPQSEMKQERAAPPVSNANFAVTAYEVVERPEDDIVSYLKIFVDGNPAGQTPAGPKSQEKKWEGTVPAGNRPVRFEYWSVTSTSEWVRLGEDYEPRERFVRIEEGMKTRIEVKFFEQARRNSISITRGRP